MDSQLLQNDMVPKEFARLMAEVILREKLGSKQTGKAL
jgi:hypothetical protein